MRRFGVGVTFACAALLAAGCGSAKPERVVLENHLRISSLSLSPTQGFPGPPTDVVRVTGGAQLTRLARLVPATLPPLPKRRPGMVVCFPMDLKIGLSDGSELSYPSCQRPHSLLRLLAAMCPLLDKPGFCDQQRSNLGEPAIRRR